MCSSAAYCLGAVKCCHLSWKNNICFACFQIIHRAMSILADAASMEEIHAATLQRALRGAGRCVAEYMFLIKSCAGQLLKLLCLGPCFEVIW